MKGTFMNRHIAFRSFLLIGLIVGMAGFVSVRDANAGLSETITSADVGSSFAVNWFLSSGTYTGGSLTSPLSATGTFTIKSLSSTQLLLSGMVSNSTALTTKLTQAYLMSVGFSTNPKVNPSLVTPGTVFTQVDSPGNFPGGFKNIDVCVFSANNCSGGKITDGLAAGSSDSFELALDGSFGSSNPSLTLSDFAVKFQTNEGSFEFGDTVSVTPEPESLILFVSALLFALTGRIRSRWSLTPSVRGQK